MPARPVDRQNLPELLCAAIKMLPLAKERLGPFYILGIAMKPQSQKAPPIDAKNLAEIVELHVTAGKFTTVQRTNLPLTALCSATYKLRICNSAHPPLV
jgi:hypothetical protein